MAGRADAGRRSGGQGLPRADRSRPPGRHIHAARPPDVLAELFRRCTSGPARHLPALRERHARHGGVRRPRGAAGRRRSRRALTWCEHGGDVAAADV